MELDKIGGILLTNGSRGNQRDPALYSDLEGLLGLAFREERDFYGTIGV
jgi:hypothetical protein